MSRINANSSAANVSTVVLSPAHTWGMGYEGRAGLAFGGIGRWAAGLRRPVHRRALLVVGGLASALSAAVGVSQFPARAAEAAEPGYRTRLVAAETRPVEPAATVAAARTEAEVGVLPVAAAEAGQKGYMPPEMVAALTTDRPPKTVILAPDLITLANSTPAAPADSVTPAADTRGPEVRGPELRGPELMVAAAAPVVPKAASPRVAKRMWMEITAYCACSKCCGDDAQGITASGKPISYNRGRFVAADTSVLPFGTKISIPGYNAGKPVEVIDRGGAIKGNKIDVYFSSHRVAKEFGRRWVPVTVYE